MEILVLINVFISIFWMYVGWSAMRAHQQIAQALMERKQG
jgi:hypothetical protein